MNLTKLQLKLLNFYAKYQTKPLSLFNIVCAFWLAWLLLLLVPTVGCWYIWAGMPALGWVFIGISIGAFLRDVSRILSLFRTWAVIHEIINWERVRELLHNNEKEGIKSTPESN
jgi:hypothetical protein